MHRLKLGTTADHGQEQLGDRRKMLEAHEAAAKADIEGKDGAAEKEGEGKQAAAGGGGSGGSSGNDDEDEEGEEHEVLGKFNTGRGEGVDGLLPLLKLVAVESGLPPTLPPGLYDPLKPNCVTVGRRIGLSGAPLMMRKVKFYVCTVTFLPIPSTASHRPRDAHPQPRSPVPHGSPVVHGAVAAAASADGPRQTGPPAIRST